MLPDHAVASTFAGDRVADVLAHLHGWHVLWLGWLEADARGEAPAFPAEGYGWDRLSELNAEILSQHTHRPYAELRTLLLDSNADACAALLTVDEDRLWDADARDWLGGQSLGHVAHECLGAHYAWGEEALGA